MTPPGKASSTRRRHVRSVSASTRARLRSSAMSRTQARPSASIRPKGMTPTGAVCPGRATKTACTGDSAQAPRSADKPCASSDGTMTATSGNWSRGRVRAMDKASTTVLRPNAANRADKTSAAAALSPRTQHRAPVSFTTPYSTKKRPSHP